jgi:hypothetical protein
MWGFNSAAKFGSSLVDRLRQSKTPTGLTSLSGTPTAKPLGPAPLPVVPASPIRQPDGSMGSTGVLTKPKSVASAPVVQQLRSPAPPPAPTSAPDAGFTSTDPAIKARIAAMTQPPAAPTPEVPPPAPTPTPQPNIFMAENGNSTGGYTAPSDIQKYREGVLAALRPSEQESALRDQLAQFQGDAREGIAGLEGQGRGIPLGIVRGQQEQLQRQANIQEQTLMERLSAMSADRQAALQAAQTQLGFAQTDQEKAQAQEALKQAQLKPFEVNGSLVALNPETGQYEAVYTPPSGGTEGFTLSEGQQRYDANGNLIAGAPKQTDPLEQQKAMLEIEKLKKDIAGSSDPYEQMTKQLQLQDLYNRVNGTGPAAEAEQKKTKAATAAAVNTLQSKVDLIDQILANPSSKLAVNPWGLASVPDPLQAANRQRFKAQLNQLVNQETINNLIAVKAAGGSFGALSESELDLLKQSASPISSWIQSDGTVKASVNDFTNALLDLKAKTQQAIKSASTDVGGSQSQFSPSDIQYLQQNLSPEEFQYLQSQGGFSNDLSMSGKGSAQSIASAIKQVESGGNYAAKGGSGEFGAYQFMPSSWSAWAGQYLGNKNAPMSPQNQDKVAQARIQDLLNQGYNAGQIALIWNGGTPTVKKGVNRFGVAYDSGAYANKVLSNLG